MRFFSSEYINLNKEFTIACFKKKEQRVFLGFLWSFLNPLIMTAILYFLFRHSLGGGRSSDYFIYILIGTLVWNFFTLASLVSLQALKNNALLMRNLSFPKDILVISHIGVIIIKQFFGLLSFFIIMLILGFSFRLSFLYLPIILLVLVLLTTGTSLILFSLIVFARDLFHVWGFICGVGFFCTPVFYKINFISPSFRWVVEYNPLSQIMLFMREILIFGNFPSILNFVLVSTFSVLFAVFGYFVFKYFEAKVAELI